MRYVTDFYVKGFRPFMEPEYVVLVAKGRQSATSRAAMTCASSSSPTSRMRAGYQSSRVGPASDAGPYGSHGSAHAEIGDLYRLSEALGAQGESLQRRG